MIEYKTAQEKASEWNVSGRHIQNLCKQGAIKGAVKKAGAWFIPDDAPMPVKNTKANASQFKFVGTKKKIFEQAILLFMTRGYETVSIRDIADSVGVTQSSLYNHFKSKQELLDTIYNYYCYYHLKDRPTIEAIEPILRNGSLYDIITSVWYEFDEENIPNLLNITKIVMQRNSIDDRAREITKSFLVDMGISFVEDVFNRAVEIGRLAPMDTHSMSIFINSLRIFALHVWIVNESWEASRKVNEDEAKLHEHAVKLLVDLKPPENSPDKDGSAASKK